MRKVRFPIILDLLLAMLVIVSLTTRADELFENPLAKDTSPVASAGILPVDEAFRFGAIPGEDTLQLFWQVAPGYFLYRDKFEIIAGEEQLALELELGEMRDDEIFGQVRVLDGLVSVTVPNRSREVSVHFQGCAAEGFCYPPQKRRLISGKIAEKSKYLDL